MGIEEIIQPTEELQLTDDQIVDDDGGTKAVEAEGDDAPEPIDQIEEFPDTLDDDDQDDTPLVRQLREKIKQDAREKAELRKRLEAPRIERTKKPDLWEDCDGDPDKFEMALIAWKDNEARADQQEAEAAAQPSPIQEDFQSSLQAYQAGAQKLGKPDFEVAQKAVTDVLSPDQQSAILMAVKNPAAFFYALGKSPNRLAQLAQIENPFKLAAEAARIEGSRMMPRKEPANIDSPVRGAASLKHVTKDEREEALIKEAQRTGNIDKLRQYRREQRAA